MSLDTYANLKEEIINWSHRDDLDLQIDTFIDLAESEMFANTVEPLRIRSEETRSALTFNGTTAPSRYVTLPTGYQSMRKLRIQIVNGESTEMIFRTPGQLEIISSTGMPRFFTVTDVIELDRTPDQDYPAEIQFIQEFTALSASNTTNAVLTNHPTIYLFGGLWALKNFANEEGEADRFYQMFINAIKGANKKSWLGRYGPAPQMRVEGATP